MKPAGSDDDEKPLRIVPGPYPGRRSRLCEDFLEGRGDIGKFFGPAFRDTAALAALAERLATQHYPRGALVPALGAFARDVQAPPGVEEQIARLGEPSAVAVFAGQQAGLFTGPLYTVYKALTVERWAADLDRLLGIPVVPCFWVADDDHDFEEVDHVELPGDGHPQRITYVPDVAPAGRPIHDLVVDGGMRAVVAALRETLPNTVHTAAVLEDVEECYAVGTGFGQAFARLWYRLFPESRLVFVSASTERLKALAAPLLARSAVDHAPLFERFEQDTRRLATLGYHRQVRKRPEQSFLFWQAGTRRGIIRDAAGFYHLPGRAAVTAPQLGELVLQRPQAFSGNVLLRPLVQNTLFPVLGVVLGPSEIAYHAQIAGMQDFLKLPRPAVLPRTGATFPERQGGNVEAQHVPPGEPQERRFNILWYRARYGPKLLQALHGQWPEGGASHWLLLPR